MASFVSDFREVKKGDTETHFIVTIRLDMMEGLSITAKDGEKDGKAVVFVEIKKRQNIGDPDDNVAEIKTITQTFHINLPHPVSE